ncbi:DUF4185 domain-containing protein [Streptomyces halobius]|uniref:DUF4185 domain-containing protein n=1 Tax=Streptomyces halobius TaxID=2879846 RepID=A0ABY4M4W3_9ACTN|nr:DUF4185 domain-containing protein [Streptomyces halobius]UQA91859.1 DUF4185 domain-containing protein [Streptomyces halobius]
MSRRRSPRTTTVAALLLALLTAATLVSWELPGRTPAPAAACPGRTIASWSADAPFTGEFARYGNDNTRVDDWTGGDGTHSVRLPDGRTLWLFSDTFLDRVQPPPNPQGQPYRWRTADNGGTPLLRHNTAVVMSPSGRLERTLTGGSPAAPGPFFPDVDGGWRWPVRATVEPRTPGAREKVVRVLLWNRAPGTGPWVFGVPRSTEVATLSLPDLRLENITETVDQTSVTDPARRVLYGAAMVRHGDWTYVFGGDDPPDAPASSAYLARVPAGRLAHRADWRFWDGAHWQRQADRARPVLSDGGRRGVGSAFTVVLRDDGGTSRAWGSPRASEAERGGEVETGGGAERGGTWVLLTMDTGGAGTEGLTAITSYWSCSPEGPWHGPNGRIVPPRPPDAEPQYVAAYNPQAHPEFTASGELLLSYDINWLGPPGVPADARLNSNVDLYRPRFLRVRLGP